MELPPGSPSAHLIFTGGNQEEGLRRRPFLAGRRQIGGITLQL